MTQNRQTPLNKLAPQALFNLAGYRHADLFGGVAYVWDTLKGLEAYLHRWLDEYGSGIYGTVSPDAILLNPERVYIGEGAKVEPGVLIEGPAVIGAGTVLRHGCYVRKNLLTGTNCVIGHATETKHTILLDHAQAPHFNYVGNSILGNHVNLGAGTRLSNLTVTSVKDLQTGKRPTIHLSVDGEIVDTGLAKLGAILGDYSQTGCNAVLNPGCIVGSRTLIYANASLRKGYYPANTLIKLRQTIETTDRRQPSPLHI